MRRSNSIRAAVLLNAVLLCAFLPQTSLAQERDVDLSIDLDAPSEQVLSGSNITYTITVHNDGTDAAPAFNVTDELPAETKFVSCSSSGGTCSGSGTNVSAAFATLGANGTATITIVANVNCPVPNNTDIFSIAELQPVVPDPDSGDNDAVYVTVLNPAPRILGVAANPSSLWPPNHKMVAVNVAYRIEDNCGPVTVALSVTSNEPVNGTGDGDTAPDWEIVNNHLVRLRAERAGNGTGRVYTITITATDSAGQSSNATVKVTVPHDKK